MPSEATRAKELVGLIERVEKATGPDREIDRNLTEVLDYPHLDRDEQGRIPFYAQCAQFTGSVDAAMALVERVDPRSWHVHLATALNTLWSSDTTFGEPLIAPDVPLALLPKHILLALLRALQEPRDAQ
jgi:hypothetical protein